MKILPFLLFLAAPALAVVIYMSDIIPQPQPAEFDNSSRGPNYVASPLPISARCRINMQDGSKPNNFTIFTSTMAFTVGYPGACSVTVGINRKTYTKSVTSYVFPPAIAGGVGSQIELVWAFQGVPYLRRDQRENYCDGTVVIVKPMYDPGPC